ncbi:MAG: hypothetical protein OK455_08185, partial [Thaumarchaeota archaeon]|nr:hypothetical protein [Nitrososphaerota archaeon]
RYLLIAVGLDVAIGLLMMAAPAFAATPTTTTVSCAPTNVSVDTPTICTITVSPGSATGTVDTLTTTSSGTFNPSSCPLASGTCQVDYIPTTAAGSPHLIGATFEPADPSSYSSSTASGSGLGFVTVNPVPSTLTLACAPSTVAVGSPSSCTASVTGYSPAGYVSFLYTGGTATVTVPATCTLSPTSQSSSSCQIIVLTSGAGNANIQASYGGDSNNVAPGSPSSTVLTVSPATSVTTVVCTPATLTVGQSTTCTASVSAYLPTGTVSWQSSDSKGQFTSNPCRLGGGLCNVSYTPTSSATVTATYSGDQNNMGSSGTFSLTANVNEMIQVTVSNSGPVVDVTLSGCSVSPTTIVADGSLQSFQVASGCSPVTLGLPPAGTNTRYLTATGQNSLTIGSCASSSCQTFTATLYYQVENTYQATAKNPAAWSVSGSVSVNGTELGVTGQSVCGISVSAGAGEFSCQGWTDYHTQALIGSLRVSQSQRWAANPSAFTDTVGGNTHTSNFFSQVLEDFQYSTIGGAAPSPPPLNYTAFGVGRAQALSGSATAVWLDSGSSWAVPATLSGSTAGERWEGTLTFGAATAGGTESFIYYHQFMVNFGFSVTGNGTGYSPPSASFTTFGVPTRGALGWVDSGSGYNYTNPLVGSTAVERWSTLAPSGKISGAGEVNLVYYHQYSFVLNFTVIGGGLYSDPRLNFTSFALPVVGQVAMTESTFWVDAGTNWGVTPLLPSSSSGERWITTQTASGAAAAPLEAQLRYYHQYLGTMSYSVKGGSAPVPHLNYTTLGGALVSSLGVSPGQFWIDSGSPWVVPLVLPGGPGERWMSNVTGSTLTAAPFKLDAEYTHQFFVEVGANTFAGGTIGNTNKWLDQGSSLNLSETPANLWRFGYWHGGTQFSYNGTTLSPALTVSGPVNETAIFFPGMTISTERLGSVVYSYGSVNGTVSAGTQATIYVPPGRNLTLTAVPNTVQTMFTGWKGGLTGTRLQSSIVITLPSQVQASFATDYTDIRTFAVATIAVSVAAVYAFVARGRSSRRINRWRGKVPGLAIERVSELASRNELAS